MIREIVETQHHTEVKVSMDKIIAEDHIMLIITEMTLDEIILEKCKITENKL